MNASSAPNPRSKGAWIIIEKACMVIDRSVEAILALIAASMIGVGVVQVFSRYVLNHSLSWSEEFQRFAHIWLVMLAIPIAYERGAHLGMTALLERFPQGLKHVIRVGCDLLWLGLGCILILSTLPMMRNARTQFSPGLGLRMDWVYTCLLVSGLYMAFVAIRRLTRGSKTISSTSIEIPETRNAIEGNGKC